MKRTMYLGAVLAAAVAFLLSTGLHAQPPGARPGGQAGPGGPGGFGLGAGAGGGTLALLLRPEVRAELELLESQAEQLTELRDGMMGQLRQLIAPDQDLSPEERRQRFREAAEKAQSEADAKVKQILLPHQQKRLEQLSNQMAMMRGGMLRGLTSERVAEQFGITEAERERLRGKAQQLEAEVRQKTAELRQQAFEELLKELSPAKQAQIKEELGAPFDFQAQPFEMPQFGRGGAGGPGAGGPAAKRPAQDGPARGDAGQERRPRRGAGQQ